MNKKQKLEFLDYAIERINEYDKVIDVPVNDGTSFSSPNDCSGCAIAKKIVGGNGNGACDVCPFSINEVDRCRPDSYYHGKVKTHQNKLIGALERWCIKFKLPYTIERI